MTIALAGVFWLVEVIRARIAKRPPSWKVSRPAEPTPPLARALWGGGWQLPEVDPKQRRRTLWVVILVYLAVAAVAAAAAVVANSVGASSGAAIASAIFAVVACMVIALVIGVVVLRIKPDHDGEIGDRTLQLPIVARSSGLTGSQR